MRKLYLALLLLFFSVIVYAKGSLNVSIADTNQVKQLNNFGLKIRFSNPTEAKKYAEKALKEAIEIKYPKGIAEAYRVKGISEFYLNKPDSAINDYFESLKLFEALNDKVGQANVYNNIGNLYQEADYVIALDYFAKAENIAKITHNDTLIAKINLNRGNIYYHKNMLNEALESYKTSYEQFKKLNIQESIILSMQDLGIIYYKLNQLGESERLLLEANKEAKIRDMNSSVASINLQLFDIYNKEKNFDAAERFLKEGEICAQLINNDRDIHDYVRSWYELEFRRQNYKEALGYLNKLFLQDSVTYNSTLSTNFRLSQKEKDHQRDAEKSATEKRNASQRFWLLAIVAGLLLVVVGLLMTNVKRKTTTNAKLTELNNEISRQKDNLDRINHHLEEIIDERTRDLQIKNKKLSEYSSYLSHQIRGPIATLKGLMNLEKEGLVDQAECINMMDKCVSEIDEKIIEMSDMLHDPGKSF